MGDGHENDDLNEFGRYGWRGPAPKGESDIERIKRIVAGLTYRDMMELAGTIRSLMSHTFYNDNEAARALSRWATEKPADLPRYDNDAA